MQGRVLIIAGSDPSGGAGIQADIKTVTALGGYAATAITALTVQNTKGVAAVHQVDADIVAAQICAVLDDIGADAIKIGMLGSVDVVEQAARLLEPVAKSIPIILDPVLVATSGDALANDGVSAVLLKMLTPIAAIVTPNLDEAAALTGAQVRSRDEMIAAGNALRAAGAASALIKGGHGCGETVADVFVSHDTPEWFENNRIKTTSTHGTGCALASAIATGIALGRSHIEAVASSIDYVHEAIATAPGFGSGYGPLNHGHTVSRSPR